MEYVLQVIERGNHSQLIANPSSLYADLWTKQHKVALESSNLQTSINRESVLEEERRRREQGRGEELQNGNVIHESDRRD